MGVANFLSMVGGRAGALGADLKRILANYRAIEPGEALIPIDAFFCYRILLGRNPSRNKELPRLLSQNGVTYREFLGRLLDSEEYRNQFSFMPGDKRFMVELPEFRFWFNTSDREMGVRMAVGQYEPETLAVLPRYVRSGAVCLDIGAQTGFFSLHLARLAGSAGQVYAFEPFPRSLELLRKNVEENRFSDVVHVTPYACSASEGTLRFIEASGMLVAAQESDSEVRSIRTVRVDDVVGQKIDFVKMDAEGHEPAVLEGMARIIAEDRPVILTEINEYWLKRAGSSGREYAASIEKHGYALEEIGTGKPIDAAEIALGELETLNVLAIPTKSRST